MKRRNIFLLLALVLCLTGCRKNVPQTGTDRSGRITALPPEGDPSVMLMEEVYTDVLDAYYDALHDQNTPTAKTRYSVNGLVSGLAPEDVGYLARDLDGDGHTELMIVSLTDRNGLGNVVLEVCDLDEKGAVRKVFSSSGDERYYYAGKDLFARESGQGAADSRAAYRYEKGKMRRRLTALSPSAYVRPEELIPMTDWIRM